jgi:endoglucanase
MIVPHNYGRYYDKIITDVAGMQKFWKTLATPYKDNQYVIFDTNNECMFYPFLLLLTPYTTSFPIFPERLTPLPVHDMDQSLVVQLNQASIDGIRAAGAVKQYIHVEGNNWNGAWTWTSSQNAATMGALTDPSNLIVYQMHQYLDSDGSGTHAECVSSTIGAERLTAATEWLRANKKIGYVVFLRLSFLKK